MNKIGLFSQFLPVAQGIIDLNHIQVLTLLLIMLIFVVILGLAVFLIVWRLIRIGHAYRKLVVNEWIDESFSHLKKGEVTDLYMQSLNEHNWLFNQFLSQGHEDTDTHDLQDVSHDWES